MRKTHSRHPATRALRPLAALLLAGGSVAAHACNSEPYIGTICEFAFDFCPNGYVLADGRAMAVQANAALFALIGITYGGNGTTTFNLPDLRGRTVVGKGQGSGLSVNYVLGQPVGNESVILTTGNMAPHVHPATVTGGIAAGSLSLPLNATVTGQTITGQVTVNALNGTATPTGGTAVPSSTNNTVGKSSGPNSNFYAQGATPVAVPASHNLAVSAGSVSGSASGPVSMPVSGTMVSVGPNSGPTLPVSTVPPRVGMSVCIAVQGLFPPRP